MHEYLSDLEQRNGPAYLELVAIFRHIDTQISPEYSLP